MVTTALLLLIYLSFISLGLPDSMLGGAWPTMAETMRLPLWGAGLIQMTVSFCTIVSSLNAARLIRAFGTGKLTAISVATTAVSLLGFSFSGNYLFFLILAIPLGLGAGAVDAGLNNYIALHCEARHMSWLHCFWGVGATVGPMILSSLLSIGFSWRAGYRVVGTLQALLCAILFLTLPLWKKVTLEEEEKQAKVLTTGQVLALPGAKPGMITFMCYCAIESTLGLWAATFMVVVRGVDPARAAFFASMYYIGITVGRAISGFMTLRFTPKQMVRIGQGVLIAGCLMLFVPVDAVALAGFVICGLGCAPIYPNIIQDTPVNYGAENSQAAIGVQMASAYVGSTFVPTLFGALAGFAGYALLAPFALALSVLMTAMFTLQKRIVENR